VWRLVQEGETGSQKQPAMVLEEHHKLSQKHQILCSSLNQSDWYWLQESGEISGEMSGEMRERNNRMCKQGL
jgi:hypothetical protein